MQFLIVWVHEQQKVAIERIEPYHVFKAFGSFPSRSSKRIRSKYNSKVIGLTLANCNSSSYPFAIWFSYNLLRSQVRTLQSIFINIPLMNFPLPDNRIANYAKVAAYLPHLTCQSCHSLTLQQLICLNCHENICFKCVLLGCSDQIPEPQDITLQTIPITRQTKYISAQYFRGGCPFCETATILSSHVPKLLHRLYTSVRFQCQNRVEGCAEELCYPDLRVHEQKCKFNTMVCPNQECGQSTLRKDFLSHVSVCDPNIECICGGVFKDKSQHTAQSCLKNQCDTLKSQLLSLRNQNENSLIYSSPTKPLRTQPQTVSPYTTSPFSLQALLQKSAQIMNENS